MANTPFQLDARVPLPQRCAWAATLLCLGLGLSHSAVGMGNNDYTSHIAVTNVGSWINSLNVDPSSGKVFVSFNHSVRVYPSGAGGQPHELEFAVDPAGSGGSSPAGTVLLGGQYYVAPFWREGSVFRYDSQGKNQQRVFVVNDQVPYNDKDNGSIAMAANSAGDLLISTKNLPGPTTNAPGLIVKGTDGTTRWFKTPPTDPQGDVLQMAVDSQDNVYAAGDGFGRHVQVYDSQGTPLRTIGPVQGSYSAGVAVDRCGYVYVTSGGIGNIVEKFDPAGNKVATLQDSSRSYGSNRGSRHVSVDPSGKTLYLFSGIGAFFTAWTQTTSPPPAPTVLASAPTAKEIQTSWNQPAECISAYAMDISADGGQSWSAVALSGTAKNRTITSADTPLTGGQTYLLRMTATDADGTSSPGQPVSVTLPAAPVLPPPVITATASTKPPTLRANWTAPAADVSSYLLQVSSSSFAKAAPVQFTLPGNQTSRDLTAADIPGLAEGQTYYLQVSATNPDATSAFSAEAKATIPTTPVVVNPPTGAGTATPVPTLGEWSVMLLASLMALVGMRRVVRRD
ncbi:IPTL-CTERM sorting domain-containing protein [Diaphorobacter caeni]|uniref:IPTL-CTERM sorting domain-containing protein n=1 Tax=Diaphorobacter caeni TaxID=2784387 RepID=UPI0018903D90|nr:IPTL-CTERM sorting domain-containing protein [Diaphorobacter caeni]MBF5005209.1 IPTL-CTERM sorting domain-containing protein [Diaphorobacter caeni]